MVAVLASKVDENDNFFRTDDQIGVLAIIPRTIMMASGRWLEREVKLRIWMFLDVLSFFVMMAPLWQLHPIMEYLSMGFCWIIMPSTPQPLKQKLLQTK